MSKTLDPRIKKNKKLIDSGQKLIESGTGLEKSKHE